MSGSPTGSSPLGNSWGFVKGFGSGVLDGVVSAVEGGIALGKGGYALATDSAAREQAWNTTKQLVKMGKDYAGRVYDDPAQAFRDGKDGVNRLYTAFDQARQEAAVRGESAEFWGRATFEVGSLVVPVGAATKLGKLPQAAKAVDTLADSARIADNAVESGGALAKAEAVAANTARHADSGCEMLSCAKAASKTSTAARKTVAIEGGKKGDWPKELNAKTLHPNTDYIVNGYTFKTDEVGRVTSVQGKLDLSQAQRNDYQQKIAGRSDRLPSDHGGHLIGSIFNGPGDRVNLVAMDGNFNQGAWRSLERKFETALKEGKGVDVEIHVSYPPGSQRPDTFSVMHTIDGFTDTLFFDNVPGG